jgi:gamma-glutamyltranspeptidase/glutathione hydrolase/leukotriene-C4 hydrolase
LNLNEWVEVFAPNGTLAKEGDVIKRPTLAATLRTIANDGPDAFYNGFIAESIVNTTIAQGGILTLEDLAGYTALSRPVISTNYHGYKVTTTTAPSSGPVLLNILNLVESFNFEKDGRRTGLNVHRLIESFKFAYAARTELGDPSFIENQTRLDEIITKEWANLVRQNITDVRWLFFFLKKKKLVLTCKHDRIKLMSLNITSQCMKEMILMVPCTCL